MGGGGIAPLAVSVTVNAKTTAWRTFWTYVTGGLLFVSPSDPTRSPSGPLINI